MTVHIPVPEDGSQERRRWAEKNLDPSVYQLVDKGFIYPEYYIIFTEEKYATLYRLRFPQSNDQN